VVMLTQVEPLVLYSKFKVSPESGICPQSDSVPLFT
jgi:hypothetical protein